MDKKRPQFSLHIPVFFLLFQFCKNVKGGKRKDNDFLGQFPSLIEKGGDFKDEQEVMENE